MQGQTLWNVLFRNGDLPKLTTQTFIGIMVAITGNVLISLALNLQKLAHKRVESSKTETSKPRAKNPIQRSLRGQDHEPHTTQGFPLNGHIEDDGLLLVDHGIREDAFRTASTIIAQELQPLPSSPRTTSGQRDYGSRLDMAATSNDPSVPPDRRHGWGHRFFTRGRGQDPKKGMLPEESVLLRIDTGSQPAANAHRSQHCEAVGEHPEPEDAQGNEADYLRSKLWWLGFLLMNVGELGNFISYAWAPASVVAPLGTFALIANCVLSPLILGERFRRRDLFGIIVAIIGAVTVVLASNASDARLDPDGLLTAISQPPFIAYCCVYTIGVILLATLSQGSIGKKYVFVDVGICALFGGFTVLSTKAISTLLTMEWMDMFSQTITYPVLAVLVLTGVGQIWYLNRALMRFDSKVVIPTQFVFFTLSAIIGSAILYGDFKQAKFHQVVTFLYGCAATFAGVFIIAWEPTNNDGADEDLEGFDNRPHRVIADGDLAGGTRVLNVNTTGRRRGAAINPPSIRGSPTLRRRQSAVNLIGLSPVQHLLLIHTPPREVLDPQLRDWEEGREGERATNSPPPTRRNRTLSWFGDDSRPDSTRSNEGSISGRLRTVTGPSATNYRVGSLDGTHHAD